jgi:hypothetical protein
MSSTLSTSHAPLFLFNHSLPPDLGKLIEALFAPIGLGPVVGRFDGLDPFGVQLVALSVDFGRPLGCLLSGAKPT